MNIKKISLEIIFAWAVALGIIATVASIMFFLFFEQSYLSYANNPFPVLNSVKHPGEIIPIHIFRCNSDKVPRMYVISRTLERVIEHGEPRDYIVMADIHVNIDSGCSEGDVNAYVVPTNTPSGRWKIVGMSETHGVLVTHYVQWESVPFTVDSNPRSK